LSDEPEAGLPSGFDLAQLRKQAKDLKRAVRAGDAATIARVAKSHPKYAGRPTDRLVPERMTLRDAYATLAGEMGFGSWKELVQVAEDAAGASTMRWASRADTTLVRRAAKEAEAFDHGVLGPDEIVLALLQPPEPTIASSVLADVGLTHAAVVESLSSRARPSASTRPRGFGTNPAWGRCTGMADGMALGRGATQVADEDVLLALLYQGWLDHHLEQVDATAGEVTERLAARGVRVPTVLPSEPDTPRGPMGPRVYFPCEEQGVARGLRDAIQFRAWWGFNRDRAGLCYVDGEEDAGLPDLVRSLVADPAAVEVVAWEEVTRRDGKRRS
jgi:hypothetical protein